MKEFYKKYLNDEIKYEKYQVVGVIALLIALGGVIGWIYEFIFYYFNFGRTVFYWQGGNFLPWINIYAIGSIVILLTTYKFKKKPLLVFIITMLSTGLLEYIAGWLVLHIRGVRYWDYNTEILNFGNINGYVCLRSVLIFAVLGMSMMYMLLPLLIYISTKLKKKTFLIISIGLCSIFLIDEIYNYLFGKLLGFPSMVDIYPKFGIKLMSYK